jgi:uncharacterized membrane-anchored protein
MMRTWLVFGGLALALGVTNLQIASKERLLSRGTPMLLELAPVDPRSLIQGDYMRLDYAIARSEDAGAWPIDGHIVVTVDPFGVARFVRREQPVDGLGEGEHRLRYRKRNGRLRIGTDAFFFQEGHASRYQAAKYGDIRVDAAGNTLLVGLRDAERRVLGGEPPTP